MTVRCGICLLATEVDNELEGLRLGILHYDTNHREGQK